MTSQVLHRMGGVWIGMAAWLLLVGNAPALSPPPPQPQHQLLPLLYETLDGDNWHRNDGWLDDEVHWCDWYGVTCGDQFWPGYYYFDALELAENNLSGEMTEELAWLLFKHVRPRHRLDLADNDIFGALYHFPARTRSIDLAGNHIEGVLPDVADNDIQISDQALVLAGNRIEGTIPESWGELAFKKLDLSDNRLSGSIDLAVAAMTTEQSVHLSLAGNQFSGALPDTLTALQPYPLDGSRTGPASTLWSAAFPPGLDLCWNDFDLPGAELAEFIDAHHHGGGFSDCQPPRMPFDPAASGSWFNAARTGEGFVQHRLDNDQVLLFWFTFPRLPDHQQAWFMGIAPAREETIRFEHMHAFTGQFSVGRIEQDTSPFRLSVNPLELNRQQISYSRSIILGGSMTGLVSYGLTSLRYDHTPLTRLAGSTCDNQKPHQWISGAWYDPERDGEGFMVEVNHDGRGAVYWFTYTADGLNHQAWMMGDGDFDGDTLIIDNLVQPTGTRFGPDFDPDEVEFTHWGSLTMEFDDDLNGHIWFDSVDENYGSGDYPIERLARAELAECE